MRVSGRIVVITLMVTGVGLGVFTLALESRLEWLRDLISGGDTGDSELPPLPAFPLETMEPAVRDQFRRAVDRAAETPRDAEANGGLGMLFHAYGFHALAEPCYERAARLAPTQTRWRFYLGVALGEGGEWSRAAGELDRVLERRPDDVAALLHRSDALRRANELEAAGAGYGRVIELAPRTPQAHCGAGQVALSRGDLTAAVAHLEEALRLAPEYGRARYALGQTLRTLGRLDEARAQLELAETQRGLEPPVDDPLMQAVETLRTGAVDALHRGIELAQSGRTEPALELLEEAVRIDPDLAEAHAQLGAVLLGGGEIERARTHLERALHLDPNAADAHYNLGLLAHRQERYDEAVSRFERAVRIRPDHFDARLGLGTDLERIGRAEDGVPHLDAARSIRPADPRPYRHLATVMAGLGRYREVIDVLRSGWSRLPDEAALGDRLAWMLATCPRDDLRNPAEALEIAEAVCDQTGFRVPRALATRAAALAAVGRVEEARTAAEEALRVARAQDRAELAVEIESHLDHYRSGRPYRQSPP